MAGLFDDIPTASQGGLFDDIPGPQEEPGFFNHTKKTLKDLGNVSLLGAVPGTAEALAGGVGDMANAAVSGIYGPIKSVFSGKTAADEVLNTQEAIKNAIPYSPETESGKAIYGALGLLPEGLHALGETTYDKTGSPLLGAGVEALGNAALLFGGGKGAKGKKAAKQLELPEHRLMEETTKPVEGQQMSLPFEQRGLFDDLPSQSPLKAPEELPSRGPEWADNSRQQELKFPSVEEIARQDALESPQHDMFAENYDANRGAKEQMMREAAAKQEMEQAPVQQQDPAVRQAHIEEAYKQREEQARVAEETAKQDKQQNLLDKLEQELNVRRPKDKPYVPKSQRGGLNIEAISDGFRALLDGKPVGKLISNLTPEQSRMLGENASVDIAKVDPEVRGTGIGKALYEAWAQAHEGRIEPSGKTSPDAWRVWKKYYPENLDAFVTQEASRIKEGADPQMVVGNITDPHIAQRVLSEAQGNIKVPFAQRGALNLKDITEGLRKLSGRATNKESLTVQTILGKDNIPLGPEPSKIVAEALAEGQDTNAYNWTRNTASGSILEGKTRNSALVKGVSDTVTSALKRADMFTKKTIDPVKAQFRKLSTDKVETIGQALKWEMQEGRLLSAEELQKSGMDIPMMSAYADLRDMFKETYKIQNEARIKQGLEPITEVEHYLASRWSGDFRQPVYKTVFDKEGNPKINPDGSFAKTLVWYLADHNKWGLQKQKKALLKKYPELIVEDSFAHKVSNNLAPNQLQAAYTTMLDTLGRNDPAVLKLKEAYEASLETEGRAAFGQEQHFKDKANIRGFVGDRPGKASGQEALAMFDQQFKYAKNAAQWASLQEAGAKLKEVFSDEKLAEQQPKNMEYAKDYWRDVLGQGTSQWAQATENLVRDLGISPTTIKKAVGSTKSFFITQKLAVNAGYALTNVLQVFNSIPHLMDTMVKAGGNPVKSLAVGLLEGSYAALGHATEKAGVELPASKFHKEALKYAEDNGVISQSALDEGSLGDRGVVNGAVKALGTTISAPEVFVRSVAYMTFVDMLKSTGKLADADVFKRAEDLVNTSMVDYRKHERPLAFSKLGIAGDVLNTLQTYPANMLNQYRYFGKEAAKGNVLPLVSMIMLQGYLAGAMGIPGFSDLDKLWGFVKTKLPDSAWEKVRDFDPKLWMLENMGDFGGAGAYGSLSEETGVALTSRVAAPAGSEMITAPGGPVADILGQAGTVASALTDPTNTTKRAQAIHDVAPSGIQGWLETGPLQKDFAVATKNQQTGEMEVVRKPDNTVTYKVASKLADREGDYSRSPFEEKLRAVGLRSQKEAMTKDILWKTGGIVAETKERSQSIVDKYWDATRRGDKENANELQSLYVRLNGSAITDEMQANKTIQEATDRLQKQGMSVKQRLDSIKSLARTREILEKYENQP